MVDGFSRSFAECCAVLSPRMSAAATLCIACAGIVFMLVALGTTVSAKLWV